MTRDDAMGLLRKYNDNEHLINHGKAVEAVMREFASLKGEDPEYWGLVGLLHDVDYGMFPDQHCKKAPELLKEIGADDDFIRAVVCHGYGLCSDVKPEKYMEKVLYTIDELAGLVYATALVRPEHMAGMTVKSVKKKWSSPTFAAGVNRDIIIEGTATLGDMELPEVIQHTIDAMSKVATDIGL
ncbi:MAG: hydrolase [Sphaerochaetaceae bacterium]|nr:hydrolase [Sphaerochaetaceae bacterium]MDD4006863.1 hydrolase [Sphaerochaetaceae bacterium]MDD4395993.1 hydrolase [Sphaerochaetaceae bacterium]